jgi:hypothetical protein
MHKKETRTPEEIARDLEEVVLPEIGEDDLEEVIGGQFEQTTNFNCGC